MSTHTALPLAPTRKTATDEQSRQSLDSEPGGRARRTRSHNEQESMFAAKVHSDRARQELKGVAGPKKPRENARTSFKGPGKKTALTPSPDQQADDFRARAAAQALSQDRPHRNSTFNEKTRKRSSVVAMVTKRVEMLHMNTICREFTQVLVCGGEGLRINSVNVSNISAGRNSATCRALLRCYLGNGRTHHDQSRISTEKRQILV